MALACVPIHFVSSAVDMESLTAPNGDSFHGLSRVYRMGCDSRCSSGGVQMCMNEIRVFSKRPHQRPDPLRRRNSAVRRVHEDHPPPLARHFSLAVSAVGCFFRRDDEHGPFFPLLFVGISPIRGPWMLAPTMVVPERRRTWSM